MVEASKLCLPISNKSLLHLEKMFNSMQDCCNKVAVQIIKDTKEGQKHFDKDGNSITAEDRFKEDEMIKQMKQVLEFFAENKFGPDAVNRRDNFRKWKDQIQELLYSAKKFKTMQKNEKILFELKE